MNFLLSYHTDKAGGIHQCGGYVDNKNTLSFSVNNVDSTWQYPTIHLKHQTHHSWNMKIKDEKSNHQYALCKFNLTKKNHNTPSSSLPVWESEWSTPLLCAVKSLSCKLKWLKVFLKLCKDRNANFIEKNCSMDTSHEQISVTNHWRCEVERKKIFTAVKMENVNEQKQLGMLFREAICHSGCRKQNKAGGNWGWDVDVVHVVVKCNYYYYL